MFFSCDIQISTNQNEQGLDLRLTTVKEINQLSPKPSNTKKCFRLF
jgi:hypothetical protein